MNWRMIMLSCILKLTIWVRNRQSFKNKQKIQKQKFRIETNKSKSLRLYVLKYHKHIYLIELNNQMQEMENVKREQIQELKRKNWVVEQDLQQAKEQIEQLQLSVSLQEMMKQEIEQLKKRLNAQSKYESKIEQMKDHYGQEKQNFQKQLDEKDTMLQKLQQQYQNTFEQVQIEKDKALTLELEYQKLQQQQQEFEYEVADREQFLQSQIKELKQRKNTKNSSGNQLHQLNASEVSRNNSVLFQPTQLSQDFHELMSSNNQIKQSDFLENHLISLNQVEENFRKEIQIANEKNKTLEIQVKSSKTIQTKLEEKIKECETKIQEYQSKLTNVRREAEIKYQDMFLKQQDQIQHLTDAILEFRQVYKKVKDEHSKMYTVLNN